MHANTHYLVLCHAMPCYAIPCHAMLCYAMLCYAMLCTSASAGLALVGDCRFVYNSYACRMVHLCLEPALQLLLGDWHDQSLNIIPQVGVSPHTVGSDRLCMIVMHLHLFLPEQKAIVHPCIRHQAPIRQYMLNTILGL